MSQTKQCSKCGKILPLSEFNRDSSKASGYKSQCKSCVRDWKRLYRKSNHKEAKKQKQPHQTIKAVKVPQSCPGCIYYRRIGNSDTNMNVCHYLLDTGHSSLKECGKGVCTVRKERNTSEIERKKNDFLF